jgi:hypothetical protein
MPALAVYPSRMVYSSGGKLERDHTPISGRFELAERQRGPVPVIVLLYRELGQAASA